HRLQTDNKQTLGSAFSEPRSTSYPDPNGQIQRRNPGPAFALPLSRPSLSALARAAREQLTHAPGLLLNGRTTACMDQWGPAYKKSRDVRACATRELSLSHKSILRGRWVNRFSVRSGTDAVVFKCELTFRASLRFDRR